MKKLLAILVYVLFGVAALSAAPNKFSGKKSEWNGRPRYDFTIENRDVTVVIPENPLPGNPWVWRPAFFGGFPDIDKALLDHGFYITYFDTTNEWGRPEALAAAEKFYDAMVGKYELMPTPVMNGISRGGYFSLRWAETHPDKVGCLLLDNPLVDIMALDGDGEFRADFKTKWGLTDPRHDTFRDNAVHNLTPLVENRVPMVLLSGGQDTVVPYEQHGAILVDTYRRWGVPYKSIVRHDGGHHPHGSAHPDVIADHIRNVVCGSGNDDGGRRLKVACIGNSVTEGVGTTDASRFAYPAVLAQMLGDGYDVQNFGVSCSTVLRKGTDAGRPFGYAGTGRFRDAIEWNPDIVIIKLGSNDSKPDNYQYIDDFKHDYQEIIDAFKYLPSLPEIYICLPVKMKYEDPSLIWGINERIIRDEITPLIKEVAHDNRITTIKLRDAFDGEENACYADNCHPTNRGAALIARKIYDVVSPSVVYFPR